MSIWFALTAWQRLHFSAAEKEFQLGSNFQNHICKPFPREWVFKKKGVFLVKMKNAFVSVKRDNSVNTYSRILTVPRGSEQSEWASPWTEQASKRSEHSEEERCGASKRSERCERTNIASDRVAGSKRDCLWLETPPQWMYGSRNKSTRKFSPFNMKFTWIKTIALNYLNIFYFIGTQGFM